jgi:RNA polymerase sigma factor (sigma-70 family)
MAQRTTTVSHLARALAGGDFDARSDRELVTRFVASGDQAAFAALAARHTGMVLGVCRRALPRTADAEDACQAVFLLLSQKAARVRWRSSVAGWLYTVARRVARNARVSAERRARREARVAVPEAVAPVDAMTGRELTAVLDEELGRLPPRYRDPLVLCCLEGLAQDEAAARLAIPIETLRTRLRRSRKRLAAALASRGCDLGIALLAVAASATATTAAQLTQSIRAAGTGSASPTVFALARTTHPLLTPFRSLMLATAVAVAAVGVGAAFNPRIPAQSPKNIDLPAAEKISAVATLGAGRFTANAPVGDARYSSDGKRIVAFAGSALYVWDANDGSLIRTIETKIGGVPEPGWPYERDRAFAMHPKKQLVAFGGIRDGKTVLQVWDFEAGKLVAETITPYRALRVLAWTPDGTRLLERTAIRWAYEAYEQANKYGPPLLNISWLIVRDGELKELRSHQLPRGKYGEDNSVLMHPLPNDKEVLLWQGGTDPTIFDVDTGKQVRPLGYKSTALPSGLATTPDGKTAIITCSELISLVDMSNGTILHQLPVLRGGWERPRPLFSPDGQTVYIFDFQPVAYDVATGKEKWRGMFPTIHNLAMRTCDVSPDGSTLLCMHGHRVARIDTATGTERDPHTGLSRPSGVTWSPDGKRLFTRAVRHDRTWTAWDAATGNRLYDLLPTGFVTNNEWKMMPDLFFINGGKELVAGLEKSEKTERIGPKELLVFDAATGKPLRRLGEPLPKERFQWAIPIAVEPDGSSVVMQVYTVSGPPGAPGAGATPAPDGALEYTFQTTRWDPVKKLSLGEWLVTGHRLDDVRRFGRYAVSLGMDQPDYSNQGKKLRPAKMRCYSLADGKLAHEWTTGFAGLDADRVQGNFMLSTGYESKWITKGHTLSYAPQPPFAYDVWEIPTGQGVRAFDADHKMIAALGPSGQYVLRVRDDGAVEVFEPFVLKKAVTTVSAAARPQQFEFAPDGGRVAVSLADTSIAIWDTAPWRNMIDAEVAKKIPANLSKLWDDLSGDAPTGLRAARLLAAAGDKGVALLKSKVTTREAPAADRMAKLIADLDSQRFGERERAEADLRDLGPQAEPYLQKALKASPSAEATKRLEALQAALAARKLSPAEVRELRAVQAMEWQGTAAARELLAEWAKGDPAATLTRAAKGTGR